MARALIGLGSNLGDCAQLVRAAVEALQGPECRLLALSDLVISPAVGGPPGQRDYVNAVALVETPWSTIRLAEELEDVESQLGRKRTVHWGPRRIDLDLLVEDRPPHITRSLVVPHPRMTLRPFVLGPASQVAPSFPHPLLRQTMRELWEHLRRTPRWIYWRPDPRLDKGSEAGASVESLRRKLGPAWYIGASYPSDPSALPRLAVCCQDDPNVRVDVKPGPAGDLLTALPIPPSGWDTSALCDMVALIEGTETPLRRLAP
ncbi:MAG TPA: 2-amino-4-hydroxy-6-hydroxymethyldihydropteridine diphosphokinase [Planctomycetaceae bacterium]|nr:2-amino-4-hydroxy-6-hydroxymethyldihydropteridine diphosphokinase [Planctomycetaceae bacterium]